jgi:hypothetical protein
VPGGPAAGTSGWRSFTFRGGFWVIFFWGTCEHASEAHALYNASAAAEWRERNELIAWTEYAARG